jgi:drug/metabolite transporter, DME family
VNPSWLGPAFVALGAALWGTESAWRIPLNDVLAPDVIVLYEHVILVAMFLPLVLPRLGELRNARPSTLGYLLFSGVAGSAVGAVLFTTALAKGNPTVVNVVLNLQPVLSTTAACLLFGDRLSRDFYPWATLAVLAGMVLSIEPSAGQLGGAFSAGTAYAFSCALFWGLSTVAGRGVMTAMSLPLASGLRVIIGLVTMLVICGVRGELGSATLWPALAQHAPLKVGLWLFLLASISGAVPLYIYFAGLARTRASTAGYFEMMQTVAAVIITWAFFHAALVPYQVLAALTLMAAVAMVQKVQRAVEVPA